VRERVCQPLDLRLLVAVHQQRVQRRIGALGAVWLLLAGGLELRGLRARNSQRRHQPVTANAPF
jgi:hypothetical protein